MAGMVELHSGSPASPAAAKRAAIIERYGLGRIPPIPIPSLEQIKADAGAKRQLAPEELPEANYVRRTVGALESRVAESRLATAGSTPPHSPRGSARAPSFPPRAQSTADADFTYSYGTDADEFAFLDRTRSAPDGEPLAVAPGVAAAAAEAAAWSRTATSQAGKARVWPEHQPPPGVSAGYQGMVPNGSPARRTVSEDPAQLDGHSPVALAEQKSAPPGYTAPNSAVDLASALAEASAWMASSRGGARGGSAGNLATAAGGARASPLLLPEDALDTDAAPLAASQRFAHPSVGGDAAVDPRSAAQPGVSAVELQTALSMIGEDEERDGLGSGAGPVQRLQPRQLTVGGAPRKASDAMVVSIDGAIAAAATELVDDIRRRNAAGATAAAAVPAQLSVNPHDTDDSDEDLDPVPMSARLRRWSAELQVVAPARGYVSAPSSPRAYIAAATRAQAEWGGSDASDDADGASPWAGFAKPLQLLPLRNCRLRPSSAPQPVWREMAAEAGIETADADTRDKKKPKRSPRSHAVDITPSPALLRRGSHHESISSGTPTEDSPSGSRDLDFSDRPPTSNPIFDTLHHSAVTSTHRHNSKDAAAKELRRKRRRAARQESLRRRYGGSSPKAFPLDGISSAARPSPDDAPNRGLESLLRDLQGPDYPESSATDTSGTSTPHSGSPSPRSSPGGSPRDRPLVSSLASQRSRRSASRLSQASGAEQVVSLDGSGDSAFEQSGRKVTRRLSWADEHQGSLSSDLAAKEQYSSGLATCQEMPGSPLATGDESPPDAGPGPTDDMAPPTPDQLPAAGPLQQQHQQPWAGDSSVGRAPSDAALEQATWHRQAAEAEHRHRVAEAQAAADRARAAGQRLALERKAEEEQQVAVAAAAAGQLEAAAAAERTAAAAHAAAQQAAAEAGSSGVNVAHLHGVSLLQQDPGSPVRRPTPSQQRITFSEIEPADDAPRVHMAVDSPQRPAPLDAQRQQEAAAGHARGAGFLQPLPPPQPLHHGQQHAGHHQWQHSLPPPSPPVSEAGSRSSRLSSFSLLGAAARGVREGIRRLSTDGGAFSAHVQAAGYKGQMPAYGGEVMRSSSFSQGRRPSVAHSRSAHLPASEAGNGLPPAPRRSFSSGGWKGRNQQDAGGGQQYESVVVRTATGDKLVVRRPITAPGGGSTESPAANGLAPRPNAGGSRSGQMRPVAEHPPADAGAAMTAAAAPALTPAAVTSQQPPGPPPPSPKTPSGGGRGLFRKVMSRRVHKEAPEPPPAAGQPPAAVTV